MFSGALHRRPTLVPSTHRQIVPTPAYEEEVEATFEAPSLAELEAEEARRREKLHGRKDSPYLMFEVTSDDGFHVRSENLDGESSGHPAEKCKNRKMKV